MNTPLRLMCILAHPDDESLGMGDTLATYAAEGVETYLFTLRACIVNFHTSLADIEALPDIVLHMGCKVDKELRSENSGCL